MPQNRIRYGLLTLCIIASTTWAGPKNVLLICVDDLRPELNCYGADYIHSPNIDKLAASGRAFSRHYVNAPTCGASRYTLLTGQYGISHNGALFARAGKLKKEPEAVPPSMPEWFRKHGYSTVSVGKISHHPGGRGGRRGFHLFVAPDRGRPSQRRVVGARHVYGQASWRCPMLGMST